MGRLCRFAATLHATLVHAFKQLQRPVAAERRTECLLELVFLPAGCGAHHHAAAEARRSHAAAPPAGLVSLGLPACVIQLGLQAWFASLQFPLRWPWQLGLCTHALLCAGSPALHHCQTSTKALPPMPPCPAMSPQLRPPAWQVGGDLPGPPAAPPARGECQNAGQAHLSLVYCRLLLSPTNQRTAFASVRAAA